MYRCWWVALFSSSCTASYRGDESESEVKNDRRSRSRSDTEHFSEQILGFHAIRWTRGPMDDL